ncbi:MAG: quinolinate synthase NadA [Dehalococcoidia bacterium]|nr:quinolinate synthase NadA [Dehalococcoidia bacterium]MDW8119550.1 quinolinate synthase NadA [Chloroflexota bacterium]
MAVEVRVKTPRVPLTELEQSAFCRTDDLKTLPLKEEWKAGVRWQRLPPEYMNLTAEELVARIRDNRRKLGKRVVILGHHYQRPDIIQFADFRGDSFKLSQLAAQQEEAEFIIFCGVHFMAETARILCRPHQRVILPNLMAGCSMADMAPTEDVYDCWQSLQEVLGPGQVLPVTYMNSTAAIKALCGENGGIVCTSSNALAVFTWSYAQAPRMLFVPDQHLGRNIGLKFGLSLDDMVVWNPFKPLGGLTPDALRRAKLILWKGHCSVHTRFTVEQIRQARAKYPNIKIIVHPECVMEVVQSADYVGSTEYIVKTISSAPPGTVWGVGTEINLVTRIAQENPDKIVFCLDPIICPCSTMYRIHPAYLLWVTDALLRGEVVNEILVPPHIAYWAKVALDKMLQVV